MIYAKDVKEEEGTERGCIYKVVTDTSSITHPLRLSLSWRRFVHSLCWVRICLRLLCFSVFVHSFFFFFNLYLDTENHLWVIFFTISLCISIISNRRCRMTDVNYETDTYFIHFILNRYRPGSPTVSLPIPRFLRSTL